MIAAAVIGHSKPSFAASVYQHVLPGMTDLAATALDEALGHQSARKTAEGQAGARLAFG